MNAKETYARACKHEQRTKNGGKRIEKAIEILTAIMAVCRIAQILNANESHRATVRREEAARDLNVSEMADILRDYKWG